MKEEKNKPIVSVIIPCYNVEKYLDRCMDSVVNQSYGNLEIILVDDGSPDSSGQMCDDWAKKDKRVKVVHKANGGLGFARNSGLEHATGEYVAFIDSDDYIDTTMYDKLVSQALTTNSDIVYCGHIKQMHDGSEREIADFPVVTTFEREQLLQLSQGFFKPTDISTRMLTMSVWHSIYRRTVITQLFYSEREVGSEDIHFQVCAMLNSNRVSFIPEALYVYCYNGESLSHTFNLNKYDRYKRLREIINDTYASFGISNPADYCVFMMAFALIRRIALSDYSTVEKRQLTEHIVKDPFWKEDYVESKNLTGSKRIFYRCLKSGSVNIMMFLSKIYCIVKYRIGKKALQ